MVESTIDRIARWADLEKPQKHNYTVNDVKTALDENAQSGFSYFAPRNLKCTVLGVMMGDSFYGVRIGIVKNILAQTLHSRDAFAAYLGKTVPHKLVNAMQARNTEVDQVSAALDAHRKKMFYGIRKRLGRNKEEEQLQRQLNTLDYIDGINVNEAQDVARAYSAMAGIVRDLALTHPETSPEKILELVELDHPFSGKWNGTGRNATFTDERMRLYGAQLQQRVSDLWGMPTLSERELFPPQYPE